MAGIEAILREWVSSYAKFVRRVYSTPVERFKKEGLATTSEGLKTLLEERDIGPATFRGYDCKTKFRDRHIAVLAWFVDGKNFETVKEVEAFGSYIIGSGHMMRNALMLANSIRRYPFSFDNLPLITVLVLLVQVVVLRYNEDIGIDKVLKDLFYRFWKRKRVVIDLDPAYLVKGLVSKSIKLACFFLENIATDRYQVTRHIRMKEGWRQLVSGSGDTHLVVPRTENAFFASFETELIKDLTILCEDGGDSFLATIVGYLNISEASHHLAPISQ